jgi:2-methylcitrate dehydratase PrpD
LSAVSPGGRFDVTSPVQAANPWKLAISKLSVKKYPLCFCTHRALDGMLDLVAEHAISGDEIESITAMTSVRNTKVLRNHNPQTGLEAKFSMEFAMASCVVAGRAGLTELVDDFVVRKDVQDLMKKVMVLPDEREHPNLPGYSPFDLVTVKLKDGKTIESRQVVAVRGGPDLPLSREQLWAKFEDCARVGHVEFSSRALFDALMSLGQVARVSDLPGLASGKK